MRRSDAWALIPVGRCVKITAVSTLLRFWPPGPLRRVARNSHCAASTVGIEGGGMVARCHRVCVLGRRIHENGSLVGSIAHWLCAETVVGSAAAPKSIERARVHIDSTYGLVPRCSLAPSGQAVTLGPAAGEPAEAESAVAAHRVRSARSLDDALPGQRQGRTGGAPHGSAALAAVDDHGREVGR